jgi:hypothetical protein
MLSLQVVLDDQIIEEKLFAEVTPRMRQNFRAFFGPGISMLNVLSQRFQVVDTLLTDKNRAPF